MWHATIESNVFNIIDLYKIITEQLEITESNFTSTKLMQ